MTVPFILAVLAGFSFSLIAVAYRSNAALGIPPAFAAVLMGLAGVVYFGFRSFLVPDAPGFDAPAQVWIWGLVNGCAQGLTVYLYRVGLRHGSLGPIWCAGNLTFVTPSLYAVWQLGETLSLYQKGGMAAAFLCVAVSSIGHGEEPARTGTVRASPAQRLLYGGILLSLVFLTGLVGVGLKHMSATVTNGIPLNPRFNDCFMLGLYGALFLCVLGEILRFGKPKAAFRRLLLNGGIAAAGSVGGMALTARVSDMPGGIGFAIVSISAVMAGALITAFGFHDKRGPAWYATLGLAVAAVLLFNLAR